MGVKIRDLRMLLGMTQEYVASAVNCTCRTIYRYENNQIINPNYYLICRLARLFNVDCDYFYEEEKQNENKEE